MKAVGITLNGGPGYRVHLEPQIFTPSQAGSWGFVFTITSNLTTDHWTSPPVFFDEGKVKTEEQAVKEVTRQLNALVKAMGLKYT